MRRKAQAQRGGPNAAGAPDLCGLVYASPAMHRVVSLAVQVATADVPVLITGPNGAGKEKIAEIVQANSLRRDKPFVKVNVGALPDELLESELFGAEAGAYTGATRSGASDGSKPRTGGRCSSTRSATSRRPGR